MDYNNVLPTMDGKTIDIYNRGDTNVDGDTYFFYNGVNGAENDRVLFGLSDFEKPLFFQKVLNEFR
jgi:hypothetical protein